MRHLFLIMGAIGWKWIEGTQLELMTTLHLIEFLTTCTYMYMHIKASCTVLWSIVIVYSVHAYYAVSSISLCMSFNQKGLTLYLALRRGKHNIMS